jgi:hypothetical protein
LHKGERIGPDRTDSALLWRVELSAANADVPAQYLFKALLDHENVGGKKLQKIVLERGETAARKYFQRDYAKALAWVREHPVLREPSLVEAIVAGIEREASRVVWAGKAGANDFHNLQAHCAIARRLRCLTYYASVRELAEIAGLDTMTISRSNKRLVNGGVLKLSDHRKLGTSQRWTLLPRGRLKANRTLHSSLQGGVRKNVTIASPTLGVMCGARTDWGNKVPDLSAPQPSARVLR